MKNRYEVYEGNEPYIFISYSHKDSDEVLEYIGQLSAGGFRIWYDEGIYGGDKWGRVIPQHIKNCSCMLCFISGNYQESDNCMSELHYSRNYRRNTVIVKLREFEMDPELEMAIISINHLNAYDYSEYGLYEKLSRSPWISCCRYEAEEHSSEPVAIAIPKGTDYNAAAAKTLAELPFDPDEGELISAPPPAEEDTETETEEAAETGSETKPDIDSLNDPLLSLPFDFDDFDDFDSDSDNSSAEEDTETAQETKTEEAAETETDFESEFDFLFTPDMLEEMFQSLDEQTAEFTVEGNIYYISKALAERDGMLFPVLFGSKENEPEHYTIAFAEGTEYIHKRKLFTDGLIHDHDAWKGPEKAILPDSLTLICDEAFRCCRRLRTVNIPKGVTSIGSKAFDCCNSLEQVKLPESVLSIGSEAFRCCGSLKKINIPAKVSRIEDNTFGYCKSLDSIELPPRVCVIGEEAFKGCVGLSKIIIKGKIVSTGRNAFSGCSGIKQITSEKSTYDIICSQRYTFTSDKYPEVSSHYDYYDPNEYYSEPYDGGYDPYDDYEPDDRYEPDYDYDDDDCEEEPHEQPDFTEAVPDLSGAAYRKGDTVYINRALAESEGNIYALLFGSRGKEPRHYTIAVDSGTQFIREDKFSCGDEWRGPEEVILPDSVTRIEARAFSDCWGLRSINIPKDAQIRSEAFTGCTGIKEINARPYNHAVICEQAGIPADSVKNTFTGEITPAYDWYPSEDIAILYVSSRFAETDCSYSEMRSVADSYVDFIEDKDPYSEYQPYEPDYIILIEDGAERIGSHAFDCYEEEGYYDGEPLHGPYDIIIPETVKEIGEYAFCCCESLGGIVLPEGVTKIGKGAFEGCTYIESVNIPAGVAVIEDNTFFSCVSLKEITIPEGVTRIGNKAFARCKSLTSLIIPESVTEIGEGAFMNCTCLEKLTVPESVKAIGENAFKGCRNLAEITAEPDTFGLIVRQTGIYKVMFINAIDTDYDEAFIREDNTIYVSSGTAAIEDSMYIGLFGSPGRESAHYKIVIRNGTKKIAADKFGCAPKWHGPEEIIIPDTVKEIGEGAFSGCRKLQRITLSAGLREISDLMLSDCISLREITLPEGLEVIGDGAFMYCTELRELRIPQSVKEIGTRAFIGCEKIERIIFEDRMTDVKIGDGAFTRCSGLKEITAYKAAFEIICSQAQLSAEAVSFTETEIGYYFENGTYYVFGKLLEKDGEVYKHLFGSREPAHYNIAIAEGVEVIPERSFLCKSLISEELAYYDIVLSDYCAEVWLWHGPDNVSFPDSLKEIGSGAFQDCSRLRSAELPEGAVIGQNAFGTNVEIIRRKQIQQGNDVNENT